MMLALAASFALSASADDSPYFTINETYALSPSSGEVIAFLPRRYLLYIAERNSLHAIGRYKYARARTQDGVDALVLATDVSRGTFASSIGSHQIIFNTEADLCKTKGCDSELEEDVWRVARGDAFELIGGADADILTLRNGDILGYLPRVQLEDLISKGHVTRTDERHPRYEINKAEAKKFATRCSEHAKSAVMLDAGEVEQATQVLAAFDVGTLQGDRIEFRTPTYGGDGEKIVFQVYSIEDTWPQDPNLPTVEKRFYVVAVFHYVCERSDLGQETLKYIRKVQYWSSRKQDKTPELSIDDTRFRTPVDLFQYTGAPYLLSINSTEQYEFAIEVVSELLEDRALAGYALSEINRSCASKYRKSKCRKYHYPPSADGE